MAGNHPLELTQPGALGKTFKEDVAVYRQAFAGRFVEREARGFMNADFDFTLVRPPGRGDERKSRCIIPVPDSRI
jgi:hypothetical protein